MRLKNHDLLDVEIGDWFKKREHYEVMHLLQKAGIACGPVLKGREILENPHLNNRDFFIELDHKDAGTHKYAGNPIKASKTPPEFKLPAPCLGEHNDYVLSELLGLFDDKIDSLKDMRIVSDKPA